MRSERTNYTKGVVCKPVKFTMSVRSHKSTVKRRVRGFTLLELLVVLLIMSLLAALLLPAARYSRLAAAKSVETH